MRKIIHHLRRQPEHVRRHVLHISTIIAGVILILLWVYSLGANFNNPDIEAKMSNDLEPLSALKDNIVGGYQSLSD
jgi:hypothetical protein